jgi:hypothetical protein
VPYAGPTGGVEEVGAGGVGVDEESGDSGEQGCGVVELEAHGLGLCGQAGPLGVAGQGPYGTVRGDESVDEGAADVAGGADHCDHEESSWG